MTSVDENILINPTAVSSTDRSFFYGDGCFTTIRKSRNSLILFDKHIERLKHDTARLKIEFFDWDKLIECIGVAANGESNNGVIRVLISRGVGGRGYAPPKKQRPVAVITTHNYNVNESSVALKLGVADVIITEHPSLVGLKHNNRLVQVMAKQELQHRVHEGEQFDDLLMKDSAGNIIESTAANLFYRKEGQWCTPTLNDAGVKGVMRSYVIDYFKSQDMAINYKELHLSDLTDINAVFLSNALMGVRPVASVVHKRCFNFDVGVAQAIANEINKQLGTNHT